MNPVQFSGTRMMDKSVLGKRKDTQGEERAMEYLQSVKDAGKPFDERIDALADGVVLDYGSRLGFNQRGAFEPQDFVRIYFPYSGDSLADPRMFDVTVDEQSIDKFLPPKEERDALGKATQAAFEAQRTDLWQRATDLAEAAEKAIGAKNIGGPLYILG